MTELWSAALTLVQQWGLNTFLLDCFQGHSDPRVTVAKDPGSGLRQPELEPELLPMERPCQALTLVPSIVLRGRTVQRGPMPWTFRGNLELGAGESLDPGQPHST